MKKSTLWATGILFLLIYSNFVGCGKEKCMQPVPCISGCKPGDVNHNGRAYETADAVLFASYFVEGISVFSRDPEVREYQCCATDVNADCRELHPSDLVCLVWIKMHGALPHPTLSSDVANVIVSKNTITTECASPIGAIWFEFDRTVVPTLLAGKMEMMHKWNKVLVWSRVGNCIKGTAQVLRFAGDAQLVSVTAVDRDSRELKTYIIGK